MKRLYWLLALALLCPSAVALAEPTLGRVTGRIDCQATECRGVAALWSAAENIVPAPDKHVLVPAVVSALNADGSFELIAPVGDYYVGAQVRNTPGPLFGSPRLGDQVYLIREQDETGYRVTVTANQITDIGLHTKFWNFSGLTETPKMGVTGQVLDLDQQPVAGLLVFAFADPGTSTTPLAISARTGADGRFVLPLARPGQVYLRARKNYRGGQPQAEDYVGVTAGKISQPVIVEQDRLTTDVRVMVRKLPSVLEGKNAPNNARPQFN